MKRSLIYLLIAVLVAGVLGTLVARDPGYVLISYGNMSLQTGLWVMLAILLLVIGLVYYFMRLLNLVGRTGSTWKSWRESRAANRAAKLGGRGLMYFQEGDFERAERFLKSSADASGGAAANLIYAARAADAQGKREQREAYLRQAREADSEAGQAVAIAGAEMALAHNEFDKALAELEGLKVSSRVTQLKSRVLLAKQDWEALSDLMPALAKSGEDATGLSSLQKRVALERLSTQSLTDDARAVIYKKLPDDVKQDVDVVVAYCRQLKSETAAEAAMRAALKQAWHPELVTRYGGLGRETLARRIKAAEGWQNQHPDDAALQLCLGELYEANGDKDKAVAAYQRSVDLNKSPVASKHLGRLLAFDGDYKKSNEYFIQALNAEDS